MQASNRRLLNALMVGAVGLVMVWAGFREIGIDLDAKTLARYVVIPIGAALVFAAVWHLADWFVRDE